MSKNKIVIDLRRLSLTDKQRKELHENLHKTVVSNLKKFGKDKKAGSSARRRLSAAANTKTATLAVSFTNTNPNKSDLKASLNNEEHELHSSGTITFQSVQSGDIIEVSGESLGTTTVTIDVSADPVQMNFSPGHFNDDFFIN